MKKVLITGGAGYIGSHSARLFLESGSDVVIFDNFVTGFKQPVEILKSFGNVTLVEGTVQNPADLEKVFAEHEFDLVLHFAAFLSVNESMKSPELYFKNNVMGSLNLLEAMRTHGVKNLVFSSSCSVFGESLYLPVDEHHPQLPINPYGESKLMSEKMMKWYCEAHGFTVAVLRYFNVCGASHDGLLGDSKHPSPHLVQNLVLGAMNIVPFTLTCPVVSTPDGTPIRDYVDVEDLSEAHYLAAEFLQKEPGFSDFNLGNGTGFSVKQMLTKVEEVFHTKIAASTTSTPRQGEYAAVYADPEKAQKMLGWKTKRTLEDSILSLKKWYELHPDGYDY